MNWIKYINFRGVGDAANATLLSQVLGRDLLGKGSDFNAKARESCLIGDR